MVLRVVRGGVRSKMRKILDFMLARTPSKEKMLESKQTRKKKPNRELMRLSCILLAIFLFVATALVTTLSILGVMKTIYVWALLTSDINQEQSAAASKLHTPSNIQKLNKSLDNETMYSTVCLILAGFGVQLCCASAVLLCGLFMNKVQAIYAWIIFSCTNICCLATLIFFLNRFTKIPVEGKGIDFCLEGFSLFIMCFNLLLYYYSKTLAKKEVKIVVKAYGGYTHTVSPNQQLTEKAIASAVTNENYIV